ncbi:glycosyl hydrolase family 8 [Lactiplantibacillus plantarum]|uniref:glycosyl hydrolase family 8 n=1 Tax=Lactiplantibacillus plantarum TaxID=1590 RepID=UPI001BA5D70E|nr:glycosyl hydrolase family 8 [Lactiplantibacillus plantarum]MBS0937977.1 beta-glucanase [Lactiplantibacillus plantarum]MBS0945718.1 beta-glucanase [Lactiplantibacillus plantarum]
MKLTWRLWGLVLIVVTVYIGIIGYVRLDNTQQSRKEFYKTWKSNYVVSVNQKQSLINTSDTGNKVSALSEAQGYGMLISVQASKLGLEGNHTFNKLYQYYMHHRIKGTQLMSWRQSRNQYGKWSSEQTSATDGDLMIAQSLFLASKKWPQKRYYANQLRLLLNDILNGETNQRTQMLTVGNWATPTSNLANLMRSSDVMPTAFEQFYAFSHNRQWLVIKNTMLNRLFQLSEQHKSGLVPDFSWVTQHNASPVKGAHILNKYDNDYYYNACRVPMLLAQSHDPVAQKTLKSLLRFFVNQTTVTAGYTLSGKPLNDYQSASFSAPLLMATSWHHNQGYDSLFFHEQWIFAKVIAKRDYYNATLTMYALMFSSI